MQCECKHCRNAVRLAIFLSFNCKFFFTNNIYCIGDDSLSSNNFTLIPSLEQFLPWARVSPTLSLNKQTKKNPNKTKAAFKKKKKKDQLKVTESPTLESFIKHLDVVMGNQLWDDLWRSQPTSTVLWFKLALLWAGASVTNLKYWRLQS